MVRGKLFFKNDVRDNARFAEKKDQGPRFDYNPDSIRQRLFTTIGAKNRLASSKIVLIEFRIWFKWTMLVLLLLITILLSPQFLPEWVGIKWSTFDGICEKTDEKLGLIREKMWDISNATQGELYLNRINSTAKCMRNLARKTWPGKERPLFPDECTIQNAKAPTTERESCLGGETETSCHKALFVTIGCLKFKTERKCTKVIASDPNSEKRIAELKVWHEQQTQIALTKVNQSEVEELKETSDKAGQAILQRIFRHVDNANNMFTVYNMLAIWIGIPLVIFRRERKQALVRLVMNLQRPMFIVIATIILILFDTGATMLLDMDFKTMLRNFQNDPCYLDPKFSHARLNLVQSTCQNMKQHRTALEALYLEMSNISYTGQLCEVADVRGKSKHPSGNFVRNSEQIRIAMKDESDQFFTYPGFCNATLLNEATSAPKDVKISWFDAFFGSGVFAQLIVKGVVSSFLINLISFVEPMAYHSGMVEIFGFEEDPEKAGLSKEEEISVRRYARDKRLLPLIFSSMMMAAEIAIIVYSFINLRKRSKEGMNHLVFDKRTNITSTECPLVYSLNQCACPKK